jgi:hypothetical protein
MKWTVLGVLALLVIPATSGASEAGSNPKAVFKDYWQSLENWKKQESSKQRDQLNQTLNQGRAKVKEESKNTDYNDFEELQAALRRYKDLLQKDYEGEQVPWILLNSAIVLHEMAALRKGEVEAIHYRDEMTKTLERLNTAFPKFEMRDVALYLLGEAYAESGQKDLAEETYISLTKLKKTTSYALAGQVDLGDLYFKQERFKPAMDTYKGALEKISHDKNLKSYEISVRYRLAWAAYYSSNRGEVISNVIALLGIPEYAGERVEDSVASKKDLIKLMAWTLTEVNDVSYLKTTMQRKEVKSYAGSLGIALLDAYQDEQSEEFGVELAEFIYDQFPFDPMMPQLLTRMAEVYERLGDLPKRNQAWERLAYNLPKTSLWYKRFNGDQKTLNRSREMFRTGAKSLAETYFNSGKESGKESDFAKAAVYYELLSSNSEGQRDYSTTLDLAHSYYFAELYDKALAVYAELGHMAKSDQTLSAVARYQVALVREKLWRKAFVEAAQRDQDPSKVKEVKEKLAEFEQSVDIYIEDQKGQAANASTSELLLLAASAHRDQEMVDEAVHYWNQVLQGKGSEIYRNMAIRGILVALVDRKRFDNAIDRAESFLADDSSSKSTEVKNEIYALLTRAAESLAEQLSNEGKVEEAGRVLTRIADRYPDIPSREKLVHDGAYKLAIAGDWNSALKWAESYLGEKANNKYAGDMLYLKARAHEYMVRFDIAAQTFLKLAKNYPNHDKSEQSLDRAEKLALADDQYLIAAEATYQLATHKKYKTCKDECYLRSIGYYEKAGHTSQATVMAEKMMKQPSLKNKILGELALARLKNNSGKENEALRHYSAIAARTVKSPDQDLREAMSEANYFAGERYKTLAVDIKLAANSKLKQNLEDKIKYFKLATEAYGNVSKYKFRHWTLRAHFAAGDLSETLGEQVAILLGEDKPISNRLALDLNNTISNFGTLARKYYGENVLAVRGHKLSPNENLWVKKSRIKLAGNADSDAGDTASYEAPIAMGYDFPNEWSMK